MRYWQHQARIRRPAKSPKAVEERLKMDELSENERVAYLRVLI